MAEKGPAATADKSAPRIEIGLTAAIVAIEASGSSGGRQIVVAPLPASIATVASL